MDIDDIYKCLQDYLKDPPLVIWGSGATIGFGLPSMGDLKTEIGNALPTFEGTGDRYLSQAIKSAICILFPSLVIMLWKM